MNLCRMGNAMYIVLSCVSEAPYTYIKANLSVNGVWLINKEYIRCATGGKTGMHISRHLWSPYYEHLYNRQPSIHRTNNYYRAPASEVLISSSSFGVNDVWLLDRREIRYSGSSSVSLKGVHSSWSPYYEPK